MEKRKKRKSICVLCGQEWGVKFKFTNLCENPDCGGFCTWGYEPMKPESFTIDNEGNWHLKPHSKDENEK